ncbi:MAG: hypothetical protein Q4G24_14535 [Paracoccus sp. (in: a-proteobacteria)]|uniref:hypothetical protein n=1 Tax=Paracoccus sp. TaxID=267 RepID=UPI0026DF1684|nr:hypothetical protein [Paracoccus sp. (in: a-proteobacteria)]MDO5622674.1 hypothetical protein [Paracoccus sp. (in: a-proteobacteria)]
MRKRKTPPRCETGTAEIRSGPRDECAVRILLANADVVAQRTTGRAKGRAFEDVLASNVCDDGTRSSPDKGAVGVGRVDVLRTASDGSKADESDGQKQGFAHGILSLWKPCIAFRCRAIVTKVNATVRLTVASQFRVKLLGANAHVVTDRASGRAKRRAGEDVFTQSFRGNGTADSTNGRALRVRRQAGCGVIAIARLLAGREATDERESCTEAEERGNLHCSLPVLKRHSGAVACKRNGIIAQFVPCQN